MIWFTADTHFGHANIIKYCRRPFADAAEMDETLLRNINERVRATDTLYHLGDFAFRTGEHARYRAQIKCRRVILVVGNHDPRNAAGYPRPEFAELFSEVHHLVTIKVPIAGTPRPIVLCHYAMRVWDRSHHGTWHLYGHSHGTLPDDPGALSLDVGVDPNGFVPLSLEDIAQKMAAKTFRPIDHHGRADA